MDPVSNKKIAHDSDLKDWDVISSIVSEDNLSKEDSDKSDSLENAEANLNSSEDANALNEKNEECFDGDENSVENTTSGVCVETVEENHNENSDIDVIDENAEDNSHSCVSPPLNLLINSQTGKSFLAPSDILNPSNEVKDTNVEQPESPSESPKTETESHLNVTESEPESVPEYQSVPDPEPNPNVSDEENTTFQQTRIFGRNVEEWLTVLLGFLQSMSVIEWSVIFGISVILYANVYIYHTKNITIQKTNAITEIKTLLEELKLDNKMVKEQLLSPNEKAFSSFEHQIRELKKENSKLNHMLKDVVSLLYKQKQRKEPNSQYHQKSEITKLKEQINMLKFDNEELQKQLVRTRYAKHTQGEKDSFESKPKTTGSADDMFADIINLQKWDELMKVLTKELGVSGESETHPGDETSSSSSEETNFDAKMNWSWNDVKSNIKGTFNKIQKMNISDLFSKYMNYNRQFKKKFWNVLGNIKKKWSNMKSELFRFDVEDNQPSPSSKDAYPSHDFGDPKSTKTGNEKYTTTDQYDYEKQTENIYEDEPPENSEWMFGRAAQRAELRQEE